MFKLLKIMNAGVNVPEIENLNCDNTTIASAGSCVLFDKSYGQLLSCSSNDAPTHILVKNIEEGDTKALCYSILPQMIFETTLIGDPAPLYEGMGVKLALNSEGGAYAVSDVEGSAATIYSLENARKSGDKILVVFNG